jgi:peptide deformylase
MAVLQIRIWPDEVLKQKAVPVDVVDDEVRKLLVDMAETMYASDGIGLAAPQVGVSRRVVVVDIPGGEGHESTGLLYMVNPRILQAEGSVCMTEGCLSFPGLEIDVKRAANVRVAWLDEQGIEREVEADGILAICFQHEIDHLDGIVFTDRLGPVSRRLALRDYEKGLKAERE